LAADFSKKIAADYGVLIEEAGIALRGLFIIDPNVRGKNNFPYWLIIFLKRACYRESFAK